MNIAEIYKNKIDVSIANAENELSKITPGIKTMEGMSGLKTRHCYNNILNMEDARYLEIGTWKGSSVCSAMCGNTAKVVCIDNWSEFNGPKDEFLVNFNAYKGMNDARFIEQDCFNVDITELPKFNIYMYDGDHHREAHCRALEHYYECLDNIFIYIVDDWNWAHVREGVYDSFKNLNVDVLYSREILTPYIGVPETWWNGIYIAVLQKK
jgi:hypothetical protein